MPLKVRCPLCKKLTPYEGNTFRPFCSERCKKTDLGTWASEGYAIAGKSVEVEEENVSTSDHSDSETDPGSTVH